MIEDTHTYKERLTEMLDTITKELEALGVHNPSVPEDWIAVPENMNVKEADLIDAADRVEDWDERRATLAELETRYNNIRRALKKIKEGTFGVCEISGEKIEKERLDANPAARTSGAHMDEEKNLSK